ncbi:expressed conserved protein [Echinococcus multilocularis]|uniref:Expressed conserved protein n=1 Tax=Echinococcus multilocularis TaxID=6211 RepID=A0A087W239_ECHMU|nr:expressed conserved protein [Echinococcus multilocularis]
MGEDTEQSVGIFVFLIIILVAHVACWIASVIKAVIDRKSLRRKAKLSKEKALLAETRQNELEDVRRQRKSEPASVENGGPKFAITRSQQNSSQNLRSVSSTGRSTGEHYFPKCPKRLLSTGGAKRISPEELAIMLDSYAVQPPKTQQADSVARSPTHPATKETSTSNPSSVNA